MSTCTRHVLHPTCPRGRSGFTTIHSSCCSTWRLAADGRGIRTRPQSSRRLCWWTMCESMSAQVRQPPRHNTEQLLSWACEGCRDGKRTANLIRLRTNPVDRSEEHTSEL